jgi:hypothetical protein
MNDLAIQLAIDQIAIALLNRGYSSEKVATYLVDEANRVADEIDSGDLRKNL